MSSEGALLLWLEYAVSGVGAQLMALRVVEYHHLDHGRHGSVLPLRRHAKEMLNLGSRSDRKYFVFGARHRISDF